MPKPTIKAPEAQPFVLEIPWREPAAAFRALADRPYALLLDGAGQHPLSGWSYIAADPIGIIELQPGESGNPLDLARSALAPFRQAKSAALPPFCGGLAGLLSYELGAHLDRLPRARANGHAQWPDMSLGLYDCVATFDLRARSAKIVSWGWNTTGAADQDLAKRRAEALAITLQTPSPANRDTAPWPAPQPQWSRETYAAKAKQVVDLIRAGDCFQANLSQVFEGELPQSAAPFDLYERLSARSPAPFSGYWRGPDLAVVSNSPERLVRLSSREDGALAEARPIKGTRPRGATSIEDAELANALRTSEKDRAENLMIVDLLRNDLSRVCAPGSVRAPLLFNLESFANVHHLVSTITGDLRPSLDAFDLLRAVFPGGSVTGAPKIRAAEIIADLEGEARGPYCGSLIWIGIDGAMDSSILIRSVACTLSDGVWRTSLRAGGGVTAESNPQKEVQESFDKAGAMLSAFSARI